MHVCIHVHVYVCVCVCTEDVLRQDGRQHIGKLLERGSGCEKEVVGKRSTFLNTPNAYGVHIHQCMFHEAGQHVHSGSPHLEVEYKV